MCETSEQSVTGQQKTSDGSIARQLEHVLLQVRRIEVMGRECLNAPSRTIEDLQQTLRSVVHGLSHVTDDVPSTSPEVLSKEENPIRIVIADDHLALRDSIADRLEIEADVLVVGRASTCEEARQTISEAQPDVVLLDLSMPGGTGLEVIRSVRRELPSVRFVVLTMHRDRTMFQSCLDAGASGFLTKSSTPGDILNAVREVAKGGEALRLTGSAKDSASRSLHATSKLSARELAVLQYLVRGYTSKEIASELGLKAATVDTYRNRVVKKLGTRSRPELVRVALETGLLV